MSGQPSSCLVLRLAGPLQSWGSQSQFNRRDTDSEPTKSGIVGLLAAAEGRVRTDPIEDLLHLRLAVRVDQAGTLLRDYHTISDHRGRPLLSAKVDSKGRQKPTSPAKYTGVTQRYYVQDAVFVAAVQGPTTLVEGLASAVERPGFPLALGRRSCVPALPLLLRTDDGGALWDLPVDDVLEEVRWQASETHRDVLRRQKRLWPTVHLPATIEDPAGDDVRTDVPVSFEHASRAFSTRRVRHRWVEVETDVDPAEAPDRHDPLALLG